MTPQIGIGGAGRAGPTPSSVLSSLALARLRLCAKPILQGGGLMDSQEATLLPPRNICRTRPCTCHALSRSFGGCSGELLINLLGHRVGLQAASGLGTSQEQERDHHPGCTGVRLLAGRKKPLLPRPHVPGEQRYRLSSPVCFQADGSMKDGLSSFILVVWVRKLETHMERLANIGAIRLLCSLLYSRSPLVSRNTL